MLHKFLYWSIVSVVLGWLVNFAMLVAQQPSSVPPASDKIYGQRESANDVPKPPPNKVIDPGEAVQDPLYHAIRDQLKAGRVSLVPEEMHNTPDSILDESSDELSSTEWEAVELILRAARILEGEEKSLRVREPRTQASVDITVVKQLRAIALQMIRSASSPPKTSGSPTTD